MTDSQIEILRNEIRDGFKASTQRDNALSQKIEMLDERMADIQFAVHSIMNKLLAPSENTAIRSRISTPHAAADVQNAP